VAGGFNGNAAGTGSTATTSNQAGISLIIKIKVTSLTEATNDAVLVALPTGT
jgi:hypothetical protein